MRSGWIAAFVIIVVGLGSCSTASTSSPKVEPPVRSILLTAGELPSGWAVDVSANDGSFLPANCGTDTPLFTVDPGAYEAVTFSQTSNSAIQLFEEVVLSDTPKSSLTSLEGMLKACRTFTVTTSQGLNGTLTPVSFPRV